MLKTCGHTPGGRGNTNNPSPVDNKNKHFFFCLTFNNYSMTDYENIVNWSNGHCEKWIIGREVGENGTPHLQIWFKTKKRMRFSELKNLPFFYKCHIEKAKGSEEDNIEYCSKEGCYLHSMNINIKEEVNVITDLYPWHEDLADILINCKSDRAIHWIYDPKGSNGKTQLLKYLVKNYNFLLGGGGKKENIINIVFNNQSYMQRKGLKCCIFDVPRCNKGGISYAALESIKDGVIINHKFETGTFICNSPTICVLSNDLPNIKMLTEDRWNIYTIENKLLVKLPLKEVKKLIKIAKIKKLCEDSDNSDDENRFI